MNGLKKINREFLYRNDEREFEKMLNEFQNHESSEGREIWRYRTMVSLMNELKYHGNKEFVKNALIIIIALGQEELTDTYTSRGCDINQLSPVDRGEFMNALKWEHCQT